MERRLREMQQHVESLLQVVGRTQEARSGIQQGDTPGPMLFCLGIHNLVTILSSMFTAFYLDDSTIGGSIMDVEVDLRQIEDQGKALGLFLNVDKSEMMSHNGSSVNPVLSAFPDLQYVHAYYAVLLGSGSVGSVAPRHDVLPTLP